VTVIDLNADLGESFGVYSYGADAEMMPMITSANIACGAHGGDPAVMRRSVDLALAHRVAVGAHVGLPDRLGFGRREIPTTPQEAYDLCLYQVGALGSFVRARGCVMQHLKLHGSLYMMANRDRGLAEAVCAAMTAVDPALFIYVLPDSELHVAAIKAGLSPVIEVFADRPYRRGAVQMYDRTTELIGGPDQVISRTLSQLATLDGSDVRTVCLHGDTPGAPALLAALRNALTDAGYTFRSPGTTTPASMTTREPILAATAATTNSESAS